MDFTTLSRTHSQVLSLQTLERNKERERFHRVFFPVCPMLSPLLSLSYRSSPSRFVRLFSLPSTMLSDCKRLRNCGRTMEVFRRRKTRALFSLLSVYIRSLPSCSYRYTVSPFHSQFTNNRYSLDLTTARFVDPHQLFLHATTPPNPPPPSSPLPLSGRLGTRVEGMILHREEGSHEWARYFANMTADLRHLQLFDPRIEDTSGTNTRTAYVMLFSGRLRNLKNRLALLLRRVCAASVFPHIHGSRPRPG